MLDGLLLCWLLTCCKTYHVDPAFALAVARLESGTKTQEYRLGRLGKSKYYGPFGIHRDFLKKWPIDNPYINIQVGVKALRGTDKRRVLRRYNTASNRTYERAVLAKMRELKRRNGR